MTEKHSAYELVSPDWMNESFFAKILKESQRDNSIKVTSLKISPGSGANDHYGSLMHRANIEYSNSKRSKINISLVVKSMPEVDSFKKDLLADTFIFKTEIRMYSETIPKMEAILRKYGDETVLGARAIYFEMEPHQIIIFEDLVEKGFTPLKNRMPTEEEIRRALLKIAKWHAVSYKLAQEEPESVNTYNDGSFNMDLNKLDFFVNGIKTFIDQILVSDENLMQYIPYFKELDKTIIQSCVDMVNAFKNGHKALFVLNHGDFHCKNMMFRHKPTGEFDELMLIDFQTCFFGPAVFDLVYSMYMLSDGDLRCNKRDELIYYYFTNFIETLKNIEFKGELPKMVDLQMDFLKYRWFETKTICGEGPHHFWDTPYSQPYFDNSTRREVTATVGQAALLHCRVRNLGDRAVSWIRKRDLHILTVGILTYTNDQRFQSLHMEGSDEWTLRISSPQPRDSGTYECQVSTEPKISQGFRLNVVVSRAKILGNSELFIKSGSDINLTCLAMQSPIPPSFIYWYKGKRVMNYSQRGGINVITERQTRTSKLLIAKATPADSGNYTCSPSSSDSASVVVHVINGEHPAAMQHGNSSNTSNFASTLHSYRRGITTTDYVWSNSHLHRTVLVILNLFLVNNWLSWILALIISLRGSTWSFR